MPYSPKTWNLDDPITPTDLNRIETGISAVDEGVVPTAGVIPYGGSSAPSGWLMCDGAAVSRTTYGALFAIVGTAFGVGDGSTTFNVPAMGGRAPFGVDSTQTEFDVLGETGGSKAAVVVSHSHQQMLNSTDPGTGSQIQMQGGADDGIDKSGAYVADITASTSQRSLLRTATEGASGTSANLPPYVAMNYIIKT